MLDQIRQSLASFTPAERRVAEAVLDTPSTAITWSIADAARIAKVSEPSIIRFCRRLDCDGFPDFRLKLAQQLALRAPPDRSQRKDADPLTVIVDDVFQRADQAIREARLDLEIPTLRQAIDLLAGARRIDVYGYGGSGFLASEAQHRLASLGMASVAYADPTLQMLSAPKLTPRDALFVLSFSGLTSYLIGNIEIARKTGVPVLAISPKGSVVASLADVNLNLNAYRQSSGALPVPTGRAPMYVLLDALFGGLAERADLVGRA
ncbi:MAG: MurR/RpiR family transcriptional regulator [Paracoccus sp. (in: a-proteobacteria)]|uniref:MurR/RpiR family transcriptional regulator n=1 Tax=Paracoccus sp. TaxID=267 RepID=UPI0039E32975